MSIDVDDHEAGPPGLEEGRAVRALGLGLCETASVLTVDSQTKLDEDLAELVQMRKEAEAKAGSVRLS